MNRIKINKYIVADPAICHGKLTFQGTRVMVWQILEMLAHGATVNEILQDFPSLTQAHIQTAKDALLKLLEKFTDGHFEGKIIELKK